MAEGYSPKILTGGESKSDDETTLASAKRPVWAIPRPRAQADFSL